jgi:hypothetical protein
MKKLFILMVITTISFTSFAQIGVQAGATFSSLKEKDNSGGGSQSTSSRVGFTVGVFTDIPLSDNFNFQPSLNFTQKGGKVKESGGGFNFESDLSLNYIELPLNFLYKAAGGFFVGAGPALGYGISGKLKQSGTGVSTTSEDINFGSGADEVKAFEFSGNVLAGYELPSGISFTVNYNLGFSNLSNESDGSTKNRYFGIRIGKKFGHNSNNK